MKTNLIRYACLLLVAGIASRGVYTGLYESAQYRLGPYWTLEWITGCGAFALCFLVAWRAEITGRRRLLIALLAAESLTAIALVAAYPSYVSTCLLVVVAWQIGWNAPVKVAVWTALALAAALALLKCVSELPGLPFVILLISAAFELFAIGAAHLARSEALARAELQGAQAVLADSARMTERLRISRDLHDLLGHHLTIMTIHLDVARRLSSGQAAEHVQCARDVAAELLAEVRSVVRQVRIGPIDLEATLRSLAASAVGLEVTLHLPDELVPLDPPRADAIVRCVQEVITNTLRHARATALEIRLDQTADGSVSIRTRDDGQGSAAAEGGSGLAGMRERFESLGGSLSFATSPGQGFALQGAIPGAEPVS